MQRIFGCSFTLLFIPFLSSAEAGFTIAPQETWSPNRMSSCSDIGNDALSIYANPASMGLATQHQIAGNFSLLFYRSKFAGTGSIPEFEVEDDDGSASDDEGITFYANELTSSAKSRRNQFIPTIGLISNAHKNLKVGLIIHSPFGGRTTFGQGSVLTGHIIRTKLKTVNITPSMSYSPFDMLSVGAGLQLQHFELSHSRRFMISEGFTIDPDLADEFFLPTTIVHSSAKNWTVGWTAGLLAKLSSRWNVGFSYQSKMAGKAKAYTNLMLSNEFIANGYSTFMTQSTVYFPSKVNLNTSVVADDTWTFFADVSWINWNKKKGISIISVDDNVNYNDNFNLDWHHTFAAGLGASIKLNELFSFRLGYRYSQGLTRKSNASVYFPSTRSDLYSIGATYHTTPNLDWTLGYGYTYNKRGNVNYSKGSMPVLPQMIPDEDAVRRAINGIPTQFLKGDLQGKVKYHTHAVSIQFNYRF